MTSVVRSVVTCQADADVSHPFPLPRRLSLSLLPFSVSLTSSLYLVAFKPSSVLSSSVQPSLFLSRPRNFERNPWTHPIHATLSLSCAASHYIPSRLNPRDRLLLSSTPYASRGFSSLLRIHPRPLLLVIVPASILIPLVFSRSIQQRYQRRAPAVLFPFGRLPLPSTPRNYIVLATNTLLYLSFEPINNSGLARSEKRALPYKEDKYSFSSVAHGTQSPSFRRISRVGYATDPNPSVSVPFPSFTLPATPRDPPPSLLCLSPSSQQRQQLIHPGRLSAGPKTEAERSKLERDHYHHH